ncbi:hypothetical protein U9M48_034429 [Paspalum notatum var. saurae]|uniref:Uncharacterized protein n=1 Tax=Paspalum notatum var. saurae TaxID=547442 RepID=A0AAQ3U919_PASNO
MEDQEKKLMELCVPTSADLKIERLGTTTRAFEIGSSVINMVRNQPFSGKEDPNQHLKTFLQICNTFNVEGVTNDQIEQDFSHSLDWESTPMVGDTTERRR